MYRVDRDRAAAVEPLEGHRDELAGRREENGRFQRDARVLLGGARPDRSHPARQLPVTLLAREGVHLAAPVQRDLDRQVRGGAEPEEAQAPPGTDLREPQRPIPDDPGAQKRSGLPRRESVRKAVDPLRPRGRARGVSAVTVPAREGRPFAQVLPSRHAEATFPAGRGDPAHADEIAGLEILRVLSHARDAARRLVARHDRQARGDLPFDDVQVRPADAAGLDVDQHLAGQRFGLPHVPQLQGPLLGGSGS